MKKTLIAIAIALSASMTGAFASGLTPEQEVRLDQALVDAETAAHFTSRCLIDFKVYSAAEAAASSDCLAMLKAVGKLSEYRELLNHLAAVSPDNEYKNGRELLYYLNKANEDMDRISALLTAQKP